MTENQKKEVKQRFLGRHLMVKGEYVGDILSGKKRATIRLGRVRVKYDELIIHGGGRPVAKVRVTNVAYKKVRDLTDEDARKDGFSNLNELLDALRKAYGEINPDDIVTVIEFEVIQDLSSLEPQDPYLGLQPADIARLALRYLQDSLSEEERKILRDLTITNSIRTTAVRLFGSIERRWRVRRVLRKSLEELVRRGLIKPREQFTGVRELRNKDKRKNRGKR
ncbi:ASCH domain-containing protein [Pyrofollis japonicus]|uniref:ASCH domain-containing protein n=1 Tax=Pyrofollis japonicus TaxID=3060460 RepID=UPI00295B4A76|nr:ASCH domain-containing protein [Pyrofollis japonicus]BEP16973.1 ASCH domain-containing protein [Pyrofollis japonicus]